MPKLERGLYEILVTEALEAHLQELGERLQALRSSLRPAEAADRIALHLSRIIQRALSAVGDEERVSVSIALARSMLQQIDAAVKGTDASRRGADRVGERSSCSGRQTARRLSRRDPGAPDSAARHDAPHQRAGRASGRQPVATEIQSADRIDVVMAFIRRSGIAPLLDALRLHCESGRPLRVLTTTYTGSTEAIALDAIRKIGADVRVSYDTSTTRLHAKAWLFHRRSGFSTAYIGSSNLTHSAQVSRPGVERARVGARNPDVIDKIAAVFESYWNGGDFVPYDPDEFGAPSGTPDERSTTCVVLSPIELRPEPFQERLLEQIALSRQRGHHRNLLVSATGTGKTVMAAVDYARLRETAATGAPAVRRPSRGDPRPEPRHVPPCAARPFVRRAVGGRRSARHGSSTSSRRSRACTRSRARRPRPDHFDVVIVDEFHHAAAPSYDELLDHV